MNKYTNAVKCECSNCHSISMEKIEIDYERIKADMQEIYNEGFNAGYKVAKEELKMKLGL